MLREIVAGICGFILLRSYSTPVMALALTIMPAAAGVPGKSVSGPETAVPGMHFVPNDEHLGLNKSSPTRTVVALPRSEALMQIRALADRSMVEEQWAFLADHDLWVELGINESADEAGSQVEIDRELLERLLFGFGRVDFYHFHPRFYFERLGGDTGLALTTPAATLSSHQLEAVGQALPSPADVNASVEIAIMAEAINPTAEIRHFVISMYGTVSYGPTRQGQRKLGRAAIPQGIGHVKRIDAIVENTEIDLPELVREECRDLLAQIGEKTARVEEKTKKLADLSRQSETARRLQTMPGVGLLTALAVEAFAPAMESFRCGRDFATWLGLVPRQFSSGGKERLGRVSKAGQADIRRLLIIGAMTGVSWASRKPPAQGSWLSRMLAKKPRMLVAIALANKMARNIWAMLTKQEDYRNPALAMAA